MADTFNIVDLFFEAAEKQPNKTAIIFKSKKISFADLSKQIMQTAQYFLYKGINKGDRVFVFIPMSTDLYRVVLALFKIGATAVFVDEWAGTKRMEQCCKAADCKAMIATFKVRILSYFLPEFRKISLKLGLNYANINSHQLFPITTKNDTALITFTTGSTGTPKAAKRTHEFLFHQFNALINIIKPKEDDVDMPVLPIVLLINLGTATTSVISTFKPNKPDLIKPEEIVEHINKNAVNRITASPFFIEKIANYLINHQQTLNNVRNIFTGGAPVFPKQAALFLKAFSAAAIEIIYGSTEAEPISLINAKDLQSEKNSLENKGLLVGKNQDDIEIKIIQIIDGSINIHSMQDLFKLTLPCNETGEIIVKGKHVLNQYFNNEAALKRNKIFIGDECWHRTGDCGFLDDSGNLFLTGRCNTIIKVNNKYLSPFMYESYFQTINEIKYGTIVMHHNKVVAVIQLYNIQKKQFVKNVIKNNNPELKEIIFIKNIPLDPRHNSKIDYEKLSSLL